MPEHDALMMGPGYAMKLQVSLILALVVLVLDLVTKHWVESVLVHGQQIPLTGFFNLVLTYNAGAAFSFLSDAGGWQRWFFTGLQRSRLC